MTDAQMTETPEIIQEAIPETKAAILQVEEIFAVEETIDAVMQEAAVEVQESTQHNRDIVRANDYAIILMPSGTKKILKIVSGIKIQLGKFGSCSSDDLIGKLFDVPYDITRDGISLTPRQIAVPSTLVASTNNNRLINDDQSAQSLTMENIMSLKSDLKEGKIESSQIVTELVNNSATYAQKTEFAQAKYIRKKEKKFLKSFTPSRPTATQLCAYFFTENSPKIMDLRVDTLSQIMSLGNVHAGCNMLVLDDTQGLILGSCLERMGGVGKVLLIHQKEKERFIIAEYMNFEKEWDCVHYLHHSRLEIHPDENVNVDELPKIGNWEARNDKITSAVNKVLVSRKMLTDGGFDGLLMAVNTDPLPLLKEMLPRIAGSRPIVLYSQFKEVLVESYLFMRESKAFVNVTMSESWMREYQVPLHLTGTHPMMTMSSGGGYLLTATVVLENELDIVALKNKGTKNKKIRLD